MTEEFKLDLEGFISGRQALRRRPPRVEFADERKQRMDAAIKASMDDLLKAQGDISFVKGVKASAAAIAYVLNDASFRINDYTTEQLEVWLAHVVSTDAKCGCEIGSDWDGGNDIDACKAYQDKDFQRLWYLAYFGLTEEELAEREREAQRKKAEAAERRAAEQRAHDLRRLHELAKDFNVDPKYLP